MATLTTVQADNAINAMIDALENSQMEEKFDILTALKTDALEVAILLKQYLQKEFDDDLLGEEVCMECFDRGEFSKLESRQFSEELEAVPMVYTGKYCPSCHWRSE